jgi:hypothetical protein
VQSLLEDKYERSIEPGPDWIESGHFWRDVKIYNFSLKYPFLKTEFRAQFTELRADGQHGQTRHADTELNFFLFNTLVNKECEIRRK